jgi:hypothetical protein
MPDNQPILPGAAAATGRRPERFKIEIVVDGQMFKSEGGALNKESMIALLAVATAVNMPRISGWNLYDEKGDLLASVPAVDFIGELAESTPLKSQPGNRAAAGWRALPVVTPTSEEFQKSIELSKREGRIPQ